MQKNYDYILKFVIVGSSSVGKSSILRRFADDQFEQSYISTIGIDFRFKSIYIDQNYVKLQIWDTAGQQRFRGVTKSYYKGSNAVIMVFDAKNPKSFEDMQAYWIKQTRQYSSQDRIYCFINKCDQQNTPVDPMQISFLEQNNIKWFKVSAKKSFNVAQSILQVAKQVMKNQPKIASVVLNNQLSLTQSHRRQQKKGCCGK